MARPCNRRRLPLPLLRPLPVPLSARRAIRRTLRTVCKRIRVVDGRGFIARKRTGISTGVEAGFG
eukprot:3158854-Pyramimonas_sp.AAC.1